MVLEVVVAVTSEMGEKVGGGGGGGGTGGRRRGRQPSIAPPMTRWSQAGLRMQKDLLIHYCLSVLINLRLVFVRLRLVFVAGSV